MALADGIVGARHTAQQITWQDENGTAVNLTGATITALKRNIISGVTVAVDGTLALETAASGIFSWSYGAVDVAAAGQYEIQFVATYGDGTNDKTLLAGWTVHEALAAS